METTTATTFAGNAAAAEAMLALVAAGAVGAVYQWALFGPKKVNQWIAYGALAATTLAAYWFANRTAIADFRVDWRIATVAVIGFFLKAKGTGSFMAALKLAPKSNSL